MEDGVVVEYYVEMLHQSKTKGNIYKGKIHNVDQALQAAFINYGADKNGFLQVGKKSIPNTIRATCPPAASTRPCKKS